MSESEVTFEDLYQQIQDVLESARKFGRQESGREIALVITKLQEAGLWMDVVEHPVSA